MKKSFERQFNRNGKAEARQTSKEARKIVTVLIHKIPTDEQIEKLHRELVKLYPAIK